MAQPSPVVIVNSAVGQLRDRVALSITHADKWVNELLSREPVGASINGGLCEVCDARKSEQGHHIAGRKHDPRTIRVCVRCHDVLTDRQKMWDARWWKADQPELLKIAFLLLGIHNILELRATRTGDSNYCVLATALVNNICQLLRS